MGRAALGAALHPCDISIGPAKIRAAGPRPLARPRGYRCTHSGAREDYRRKWNLPSDYHMVAPAYAKARLTLVKSIGLGRKLGATKSAKRRCRKG